MKKSRTLVAVLFVGFVLFSNTVDPSHTPAAPAPVPDCSSMILRLVDCMPFVSNNTENSAKGTCCDGLKIVLKDNAFCLCEAFDGSAQLGLKINLTKALTLPSVCHLYAPPFSDCELSPNPAPVAPDVSPLAPPPSSTPSVIPVPGTGNSTTPTPAASGASSSSELVLGGLFLVAIVVVSFFSIF